MEFLFALPFIGNLLLVVLVVLPICGIFSVIFGFLELIGGEVSGFALLILGIAMLAFSGPFVYDAINLFILN